GTLKPAPSEDELHPASVPVAGATATLISAGAEDEPTPSSGVPAPGFPLPGTPPLAAAPGGGDDVTVSTPVVR
ncbi:MAG TPA: hypothetical protein VIC62_20145, partial [Nakamurella sp.]